MSDTAAAPSKTAKTEVPSASSPQRKRKKKERGGPIRNATRTRAKILAQATKIFAKSGFGSTSTADIVEAAGVNKRLIYHYFGDKEALYRAVFIKQWGELKDEFDRAIKERLQSGETVSAKQAVRELLSILFDFMASHNDLVRLMMWEGLEGGHISRSIWKEVRGPLYTQAEFLIRAAQEEGVLDEKLDPSHYIVTFLGAVNFYFAYAHTMTDMIGKRPMTAAAIRKRKEQVLAVQEKLFEK